MNYKTYTYDHIVKQPVNKTFNSVWDRVGDNSQLNQYGDIIDSIYRELSFFLYRASTVTDLKEIRTFFDLGSLNGIEGAYVAQLMPNCNVYSFEAREDAAKLVIDNQKKYSNTKCICLAVGSENGEITFHVTPENIGASSALLPCGGPAGRFHNSITVPCTRVDTFCEVNNIDTVDLLWLDLQGFEIEALKGMGELLNTTKAIHTEASKLPYYENQPILKDLEDFLKKFNFYLDTEKRPFSYGGDYDSQVYEGDVIFLKK